MFLYHRVPPELWGTTLYPLNVLKVKHPAIYAIEARKYRGRESVTEMLIPTLGQCRWNDVLFLSTIHPCDHRAALREAGLPAISSHVAFEIPFEVLDPALTTIWKGVRRADDPEEYLEFTRENVKECQAVPDWAVALWRSQAENGQRPLLFSGLPHVLYKGEIEVSTLTKTRL